MPESFSASKVREGKSENQQNWGNPFRKNFAGNIDPIYTCLFSYR